ncbi:MAG: YccF domain-containing protein [Dermatophilaceae bacterium]
MFRLLLNLIWVIFGGFWLWLLYLLAGVIACMTIIGIPFGIAAFRIGFYALWPFGRTVVDHPAAGLGSGVGNIVWVILFGWWLALAHIMTAIAQAVTIVGIPLALGNLKLIPVSLFPLGKRIVPAPGNGYSAFGPDPLGPGRTSTTENLRLR